MEALELIRDFVNTADLEEERTSWPTRAGSSAGSPLHGLAELRDRATQARCGRARGRVREALRELLRAHNGFDVDRDAASETLDAAARSAGLECASPTARSASSRARRAPRAASGSCSPRSARRWPTAPGSALKACKSDTCRWAFIDHARNRSRQWCDMAVCGNREKARTFRSKQCVEACASRRRSFRRRSRSARRSACSRARRTSVRSRRVVMSATTFAGSAQVATVSVLGAGGGVAAAVVAALLLNARYAPIGITIAQSFRGSILRAVRAGAARRRRVVGARGRRHAALRPPRAARRRLAALGRLGRRHRRRRAARPGDRRPLRLRPRRRLRRALRRLARGAADDRARATAAAVGGALIAAAAHSVHAAGRADHRRDGRGARRLEARDERRLDGGARRRRGHGRAQVGRAGRRRRTGGCPQRVDRLLELIAPAILAALVVTETFASGRSLVLDARLAGVAAGIVAVAAPRAAVGGRRRRRARRPRSSGSSAEAREQLVGRQVGERVDDEVGLVEPEVARDVVRDRDDEDARGACAALTPFGESSKTTASAAATPSTSSASRYIVGFGFARSAVAVGGEDRVPAVRRSSRSRCMSIQQRDALETIARFRPCRSAASM